MAGFVLWFTGLSGSGKTTLAKSVISAIEGKTPVEHLDGDVIRDRFPGTGFTGKERKKHIQRVGFIAHLLEKHNVAVVVSLISPFRETRDDIRAMCTNFIEIHLSTNLCVCENRDVKGLYRKARNGEIKHFTGIDSPYEPPLNPELTINTEIISIENSTTEIVNYLISRGLI